MRSVVISSAGWVTFELELKQVGGMEQLARTPYMRNMWNIMKTFNVLPTDPRFRELTDDQINLMLLSFKEDHREAELARKGLAVDSQHFDSEFEEEIWNAKVGEWDILRDGHDANEIARQVEKLTREEDQKNLASKFDSLDEYNAYLEAGGKTTRESEVEQYINKQIAAAEEKARMLAADGGKKMKDDKDSPEAQSALSDSLPDIDKEAIDKSIALFNAEDDSDDDFDMI
jgi:hypothetical protein